MKVYCFKLSLEGILNYNFKTAQGRKHESISLESDL